MSDYMPDLGERPPEQRHTVSLEWENKYLAARKAHEETKRILGFVARDEDGILKQARYNALVCQNTELKAERDTANNIAEHLAREGTRLKAELERVMKERDAMGKFVADFQSLTEQSHGVTGLHLNGDTAEWESLFEGGEWEEWLGSLTQAEEALASSKRPFQGGCDIQSADTMPDEFAPKCAKKIVCRRVGVEQRDGVWVQIAECSLEENDGD